jgi:uncharacterized repeat protein (TIGR02543 family)
LVVSHGDNLASLGDPVRKDFSFDGWSTDQEGKNRHSLATPITGDLLLYAQWKGNALLRVDFDANGGGDVSSQEVPYFGLASEPTALSREGHEFDGWWEVLPEGYITREQAEELMNDDPVVADSLRFDDHDGKALRRYNFATPVTHDLELRAKWDADLLGVRFMSGDDLLDEQEVAWGEQAAEPQDPYRYGYVFEGWCTDEGLATPYDFGTPVTQNLTLYAKFKEAAGANDDSDDSGTRPAPAPAPASVLAPTVTVHVQRVGWMPTVANGGAAGTTGKSRRMEALKLTLPEGISGGIEYRGHVQRSGWEKSWKADGKVSGTTGKSRRMEAVQIRLTGAARETYDVYYRVHSQRYGWMAWAKNGERAGTCGMSRRVEAVQVVLVRRGGPVPNATYKGVTQNYAKPFVKK